MCWFRSLARDVLGLARLEIDWADGGLMPEPTLAEKDELDVVLEVAELVRYDWAYEDCDGGRDDAAETTAELTGVFERGAAKVCLRGSPALSASVFLLLAGSCTATSQCGASFYFDNHTGGSVALVSIDWWRGRHGAITGIVHRGRDHAEAFLG